MPLLVEPAPVVRDRSVGRAGPVLTLVLTLTLTLTLALGLGVTGALPADGAVVRTAPPAAGAPAPTAGLDKPVLRTLLRRLITYQGVGAVAQVVDDGEVWSGAAGHGVLDPDRKARRDAHFRAGSITKTAVSVLALQLVARGRWTLDTTIGDVLPGLWPGYGAVTLRQLLSHSSGMPDYFPPLIRRAHSIPDVVRLFARRRTDRGLVDIAETQPWLFPPGTSYSYSNTEYIVIGLMLRRVTQHSVGWLLQHRVFDRAGMTQSSFPTAPGLPGPRLREYGYLDGTTAYDLKRADPTLFSTAGAMVTTTRDLNRFQLALSQRRLLPRRLLRQLRSVVAVDPASGLEYGLGSYRILDPCRAPGTTSWLYGHDGATFATLSVSFASHGGGRRVTAAVTGRYGSPDLGYVLGDLLYVGFAESCPAGTERMPERAWRATLPDLAPLAHVVRR